MLWAITRKFRSWFLYHSACRRLWEWDQITGYVCRYLSSKVSRRGFDF